MSNNLAKLMILCALACVVTAPLAFAQADDAQAISGEEKVQLDTTSPVQTSAPVEAGAPAAEPVKEEAVKLDELSIYGEVQSVNAQTNSIVVQYYDYDNDEEKSIDISVDANSKLENAKAITDIKKGDWVDVNYTVSAGKNTAKMVSVEKEEPAMDTSAPDIEE